MAQQETGLGIALLGVGLLGVGDVHVEVTPTAVAATATIPAPTVAVGSTVSASAVAATATLPAPTITISSEVAGVAVAAVASIGAPGVAVGSNVAVTAIAAAATIDTPAMSVGSNIPATAVAATATIGVAKITKFDTLFANGDGTLNNVVNELDNTTNVYLSIDDDPDSPNDSDFANNSIVLGTASAFFDLDPTDPDFVSMLMTDIEIRVEGNLVGSTHKLYAQLYESNETTTLSDEVECVDISSPTSYTNYNISFTGIVGSDKATWDDARIRLRWSTV